MKEKSDYWIASFIAAHIVAFEILLTIPLVIVWYFFALPAPLWAALSVGTVFGSVFLGSWYATRRLKDRVGIKKEQVRTTAVAAPLLLAIVYYAFSVMELSLNLWFPESVSTGETSVLVGFVQDFLPLLVYLIVVYFVVRRDLTRVISTQAAPR